MGTKFSFEVSSSPSARARSWLKNALSDDLLCGFAFTHELVRDIFVGFVRIRDPALKVRIPTTLPVLVIPV